MSLRTCYFSCYDVSDRSMYNVLSQKKLFAKGKESRHVIQTMGVEKEIDNNTWNL